MRLVDGIIVEVIYGDLQCARWVQILKVPSHQRSGLFQFGLASVQLLIVNRCAWLTSDWVRVYLLPEVPESQGGPESAIEPGDEVREARDPEYNSSKHCHPARDKKLHWDTAWMTRE